MCAKRQKCTTRSPRVWLRRPEDRLCDKAISPNRGSAVLFAALAGCGKTGFASLAHPSRRFAPQDQVFHFKGLPHLEEARRAVSKGASVGKPHFSAAC